MLVRDPPSSPLTPTGQQETRRNGHQTNLSGESGSPGRCGRHRYRLATAAAWVIPGDRSRFR